MPSSLKVRAGASIAVTVFALRHDGFAGEIGLQLRDAPVGLALSGGRITANRDKIQVTLTAPFSATDEVFTLGLAGWATIAGQTVAHAAVPADDMMQAFLSRQLVASRELRVNVTGRGIPFRVVSQLPLRLTPGGTVRV